MDIEHGEGNIEPGVEPKASGLENDLLGLLYRELSAIVLTDRGKLQNELSWQAWQFNLKFAREGKPPVKPLENPLVAFGYAKALHDLAQYASRFVIPGNTIIFLLQNQEAYQALKLLSDEPIGTMKREDYLQQAASDPATALQALTLLEERRLVLEEILPSGIKPEDPNFYSRIEVVKIHASGQAAIDYLKFQQQDTQPTKLPVNAAQELRTGLGDRVTALIAGVRDVSLVSEWAKGDAQPTIRDIPFQLKLASAIVGRMTTPAEGRQSYDIGTVGTWFVGMDPLLDNRAPAMVVAEIKPDDIKGITRILRAADAFLAE